MTYVEVKDMPSHRFIMCTDCGAVVIADEKHRHDTFHERLHRYNSGLSP